MTDEVFLVEKQYYYIAFKCFDERTYLKMFFFVSRIECSVDDTRRKLMKQQKSSALSAIVFNVNLCLTNS